MICPKCKNQIPDKSLKCGKCGAKIATLCKNCNTYNSIYNLNCTNCNAELLKVCPNCKSINLPTAEHCRKCSFEFSKPAKIEQPKRESIQEVPQKTEETTLSQGEEVSQKAESSEAQFEEVTPQQLNYDANFCTQQNAKDILVNTISASSKKIISLSGQKGVGKSIVLKASINELRNDPKTWLFGECSAISQLSPCGLIQDILLTLFNVANFCSDSLQLKKDSNHFFQSEFPNLSSSEIFDLLNLIYPSNTDFYENILNNKEKTFTMLEKIFQTIIKNSETVLIIENFEFIDGMSYEFLNQMIKKGYLNSNFKIVLTYSELRPARGYLYSPEIKDNEYLDISLKPFDRNQMHTFIEQHKEKNSTLLAEFQNQIIEKSGGNPALLEQYVNLVLDMTNDNKNVNLPSSFIEVVKLRADFLKSENPRAFEVLISAAIQGARFYPSLLNQIFNIEEDEIDKILMLLQSKNFIIPINEFSYKFKSSMLWTAAFETAKNSAQFIEINERLSDIYSSYTLSSNTTKAIMAQNINQKLSALNIWTDNIKLAAYIGDTSLYIISQKQCLNLIDELDSENNSLIKNNIYERLGKLLASSNPKEAMEYLPNAISNAKKLENTLKEIELTGYLANCCIKTGDYFGTVECIDSVISKVGYEYELELAMLKSRKIDALLNIGNSGQIINLVDNEIMPVFEKYLDTSKPHKNISIKSLYEAWLCTYLTLANALVFQGNNRAFEVISNLFSIFEKNNFDNQLFICKAKLSLAFANTIKGDVEASENILEEIIKLYKMNMLDNEAIARWNLINILNNFIQKKYNGLKEELFEIVTFANNVNDNFTKNILKTLLGQIFKDEENSKRALEIYGEQITYFAKEKNALGALLTWLLISQAELVVNGPDKALDVAEKALDVAQNPKINNYLMIALYNKVIAEAYMAKSEYELAKVHLEKAILVARKFELLDLLSRLYLLYGKYLQDIALIKSDAQIDYVMGSAKMYKKAYLIAQSVKNNGLLADINKAKTVLNSFCQLNNITIKEN